MFKFIEKKNYIGRYENRVDLYTKGELIHVFIIV